MKTIKWTLDGYKKAIQNKMEEWLNEDFKRLDDKAARAASVGDKAFLVTDMCNHFLNHGYVIHEIEVERE